MTQCDRFDVGSRADQCDLSDPEFGIEGGSQNQKPNDEGAEQENAQNGAEFSQRIPAVMLLNLEIAQNRECIVRRRGLQVVDSVEPSVVDDFEVPAVNLVFGLSGKDDAEFQLLAVGFYGDSVVGAGLVSDDELGLFGTDFLQIPVVVFFIYADDDGSVEVVSGGVGW